MKFYNIACKNIRGNLYRYIMYYLSNVFSVMLFFMFANFIFHPAVSSISTSKDAMLYSISRGLIACEWVIIVFSFFFVSYSNSTFIKSRGREFGLLSLFGMTKGQIRKYVAYENITVSLLSIFAGVLLGGLFSKLFFMTIEGVLGTGPVIRFMIAPKAILVTLISFFALFQVINLLSLRKINSRTIVTQLKSTKIPKAVPKFSKILAALGVVLVAAGYIIAWISKAAVVLTMFPILFLTIAGTYFIFSQFSIAVTQFLQKRKEIFYKRTNMIVISQIIYKLKDNAKVLFLVSILGAVTLTAAGTLYALFDTAQKETLVKIPQHISIIEKGEETHNVIAPEKVRKILNSHNIKVLTEYKIEGIEGTWRKKLTGDLLVISQSDYNARAKALKSKTLNLIGDDAAVIYLQRQPGNYKSISFSANGKMLNGKIIDAFYSRILNTHKYDYAIVLNDENYMNMLKNIPPNERVVYYGFDINKWKTADDAMKEITDSIPGSYKSSFFEAITDYTLVMKSLAIVMLIGLFVTLLFMIASGSIIYFKLFTELQQDRAEFISLKKMGMTGNELSKIINTQIAVVFFLPFIISASHSSFALKILSDLLQRNLVGVGVTVILIYLLFQFIYFAAINSIYRSQIRTNAI